MNNNSMPGLAGNSSKRVGSLGRKFHSGLLIISALALLSIPLTAQAQGFGDNGGTGTFNLGAWGVDRYAPNSWNAGSMDPLGGTALKISISNSDRRDLRPSGFEFPFYDTQGRVRLSPGVTEIGGEVFIPADWGTPGNLRSTGIWSRDNNPVENNSKYLILTFINNDPADPFNPLAPNFVPRFRAWTSLVGHTNLAAPVLYGQYNSFRMVDTGSSHEYWINGVLVQTNSGANYSQAGFGGLRQVILNSFNFGNAANAGTLPDSSYDVYWKNVYAVSADTKGTPVDLNGSYQAPGSTFDGVNTFLGSGSVTTNPAGDRRGEGQVFEEASEVAPPLEGTFTPFSDANKAPAPLTGLNMLGKSFEADLDLGDVNSWTDPLVGFGSELFQIGLGRQAEAADGTEESFVMAYRNDDKFSLYYNTNWSNYAASPGHLYSAHPEATKFRVKVDYNLAGTQATLTVMPLDGPDAFNSVTLLPTALDLSNDNLASASFHAGFTNTGLELETGRAVVSNFKTNATANTQYVFANDPYNKPSPTETVNFTVGQANLQVPVGGFMAFLQSTGSLGFVSGSYTNYPYPAGHFFNAGAITSSGELAGGIAVNAPLVQGDYALANLLMSGAHGSSGFVSINANNGGGLDSQFSDGDGNPILADRRRSNVAMFDGLPPTIGTINATQIGNGFSPNPVVTGALNISFDSQDAFTGLDAQPTVVIDFAPLGAGIEDVALSTFSLSGNVFGASYNVPNTAPNGPGAIIVSAVDRAGNSFIKSRSINVNTATLTLNLQLQSFNSNPSAGPLVLTPSVTRGIEITLGSDDGGANPAIAFDRDVVFNRFGAATVVLNANDGLPNTLAPELSPKVSVKDPAHTLRRTVAVTGTGNQYTASATMNGGNINRDNKVDISDYVVYAVRYGIPVSPNTMFPQLPTFRHADISGDGQVDTADFTFISNNFAQFDEALVGNFGREDLTIRRRIPVADAVREAGGDKRVALLDLNRDGVITLEEIQQFLAGTRKR